MMLQGMGDVWWLGLRDLVRFHDRFEVEPMGLSFSSSCISSKRNALLLITDWVHSDLSFNVRLLDYTFSKYKIEIAKIAREEFLNSNDLKLLASSDGVTIGGHAESHLPLSMLNSDDVIGEMIRNKKTLENVIQREVKHFAYPYGSASAAGYREAMLARSVGFSTAVTTRLGNLFRPHSDSPFLLPRLPILDHDRVAQMEAKIAGVEKLLRHPFAAPAVVC